MKLCPLVAEEKETDPEECPELFCAEPVETRAETNKTPKSRNEAELERWPENFTTQ